MPIPAQPSLTAATIVVVGPISPGLFHPQWLAAQGIIPEPEADTASNVIATPDFSRFNTEWLQLEAVTDKLVLTTQLTPYFDVLRDAAQAILSILEYTPVVALGLNRLAHFDLEAEERWHRLGHLLAPKATIWDPILKSPGTRRVAIEGVREKFDGTINVAVEPSNAVAHGLFVELNDHYSCGSQPPKDSTWALDVIEQEWVAHQHRADQISKQLLEVAYADDPERPGEKS